MPPERQSDDPSPERRWDLRADLFQEISCEKGGVVVHSGVADLSVGGMFFTVWGSETSRSSGQVGVQCRGLAQSLGFQFP